MSTAEPQRANGDQVSIPDPRLSVAPMMQRTDRHFRYMIRQLSQHTVLYTEMLTARAVIHGCRERLLAYDPTEHPLILQLGSDQPQDLAAATKIAHEYGFDGVNLNVGCPSDRVQRGCFGAALMLRPERVAECVAAMQAAAPIHVGVKHRIGVDDSEDYPFLEQFVRTVRTTGCRDFQIHARKAWLSGLSPKQNREIPPLRYEHVHRLKREHPDCRIVINGGIRDLKSVREQLHSVDGAMLGRAAWENPYLFASADREIYVEPGAGPSRAEIVERMLPYIATELERGVGTIALVRNLFNLFVGERGTRVWKRILNEACQKPGRDVLGTIRSALDQLRGISPDACDGTPAQGSAQAEADKLAWSKRTS